MQERGTRKDPFSVSELTRRIRFTLERGFDTVWVLGEISEVKEASSGNLYMTLIDASTRVPAVLFRRHRARPGVLPSVGLRVLARGQVTVYEPHGAYQLRIDLLQPAGVGPLEAEFQALKRRLAAEGLFEPRRRRSLPLLPRAIGVLTSRDGAALRDIQTGIWSRSPQIPIVLSPALVQGAGAERDLVRGLRALAAHPDVEVIIVGRGGGSIEDLWAFNLESVARAIADCPIPVVSAVGHETDTTIADLVADRRAPTPSAAAELVAPSRDDLQVDLDGLGERLRQAAGAAITQRGLQVERLRVRLAAQQPDLRLSRSRQAIEQASGALARALDERVGRGRRELELLAGKLQALSPTAVLGRGYSIARREDGGIIRAFDDVEIGAPIELTLAHGWLRGTVSASGGDRDD